MTINIKNMSGEVIFNIEADSLRLANLSGAYLRGADLSGACLLEANLSGAYLSGADLSGAYLLEANLSGACLLEADLSGAYLRGANLSGADLRGADLRGADLLEANLSRAYLSGADLSGADLRGTVGNMKEIKSMQLNTYPVTWTADRLQIGCKNYKIADWFDFDDDAIAAMDNGALDWWRQYKDFIRAAIELSPATPTGNENA